MNKYAGYLLLDIVVDIDNILFNKKLNKRTIANIKNIKYFLKICSEFVNSVAWLDDGDINEMEFNEKINKIINKHRKFI